MNDFIGVFRESSEEGYVSYSFKAITGDDYAVVQQGEPQCPDCYPEAAFIVSDLPFESADKIKWQLKGQILYAGSIVINERMKTEITPDVVGDMIVEDAIMREVAVLRIKIEKHSPVSTSLQEGDMSVVISDDDYTYFEIDIPKEAALRDEMYSNQE